MWGETFPASSEMPRVRVAPDASHSKGPVRTERLRRLPSLCRHAWDPASEPIRSLSDSIPEANGRPFFLALLLAQKFGWQPRLMVVLNYHDSPQASAIRAKASHKSRRTIV